METTTNKTEQNGKKNEAAISGIKAKSDAAKGLRGLFEDELKDIYWAEKALTKAIPVMIRNVTSAELAEGLTQHLDATHKHVSRLEEIFTLIEVKAEAIKCEAMAGLIKEAEEIMAATELGVVRDAGIILAGQKVEHYEIATYGTLASFARTLGEDKVANLLGETLEEEKMADESLSRIAAKINVAASDRGEADTKEDVSEKTWQTNL